MSCAVSHWIFQGNPDRYDVDTYIRENTEINWLVSQTHHECFDPLLRLNLWPVAAIIALISSLMGLYSLVSADDNTTDISGDPRNLGSRLSFSETHRNPTRFTRVARTATLGATMTTTG